MRGSKSECWACGLYSLPFLPISREGQVPGRALSLATWTAIILILCLNQG